MVVLCKVIHSALDNDSTLLSRTFRYIIKRGVHIADARESPQHPATGALFLLTMMIKRYQSGAYLAHQLWQV